MGIGLADLALGDEVLRRAVAQGRGRPFPHPERLDPRLTPRLTASSLPSTRLPSTRPELHVADPRFVDVSGVPVPGEPEYWEPIIFRRAEIEAESARLADAARPRRWPPRTPCSCTLGRSSPASGSRPASG